MTEPPEAHAHQFWSDGELDAALLMLNADVSTDDRALAKARADLMARVQDHDDEEKAMATTYEQAPLLTGAPPRPPRNLGRWLLAAAAVVAVAAGALLAPTLQLGGQAPRATAEAATLLNKAAERTIGAQDPAVAPGQYLYIVSHRWTAVNGTEAETPTGGKARPVGNYSYLKESVEEVWIPADRQQQWLTRTTTSGKYQWQAGDEAAVKASGLLPMPGIEELRALCGDFYRDRGGAACGGGTASWQAPTQEFLASLPRNPQQLFDRLRKDTAGRGQSRDGEMLVYVADVLRAGLVPADLRAALYKALVKVPNLRVTDRTANLDGRGGISLGITAGSTRQDIILDPDTGQFIGERQVGAAGNVVESTSVTTGVAATIGVRPAA